VTWFWLGAGNFRAATRKYYRKARACPCCDD
jgi:hypothetical protein